ncbi:hypothetical protein VT84_30715 [Gemmata sp. SH-PL17]|uniref:hypothetical protein n=1 Tax=Gemmata sp. SH-PL17 TaxID=1630693 RepID=UPI00078D45A8|nr:hypothetical protein [Gemmata sp. SH-PL17]AMV28806.1 hypothetical protein VT84_30715 [Gemmata sp. SH-PL17]
MSDVSELDRELRRAVAAEAKLREATIDVVQSLGSWTSRDLAFAASDAMGVAGCGIYSPPLYQDNTKSGEVIPVYKTEGELFSAYPGVTQFILEEPGAVAEDRCSP